MVVIKIMMLMSITFGMLNAQADTWKRLKPLKEYKSSGYRLKNDVKYLEIREYFRDIHEITYDVTHYKISVAMQKKYLQDLASNKRKKFKTLPPNLSKDTNIRKKGFCLMSGCTSKISNGFMIDSRDKMWRMNRVEDIISMLSTIDTSAEVKLVLWLNDNHRTDTEENYSDKYRKTSSGYTVISEYDNSLSNMGECGHFTYEIKIDYQGKIVKKKLLKKVASKHGCLAVD